MLKSVVSILLGALILVTGSGVTLAKMVCLKSGHTEITLNIPDDCCKHEHAHAPVTIEEKCCDITNMNVDILQYVVSATQNIQKSFVAIEIPAATFNYDSYSEIVTVVFREHAETENLTFPPIRVLHRTFLI